ncbi:MAG: hypothetical protein JWP25_7283 [Bradyrhizobium sp.]|jgi:hypothetical protein|nr:hypothetical protein [Bradyrhizobium sp.]
MTGSIQSTASLPADASCFGADQADSQPMRPISFLRQAVRMTRMTDGSVGEGDRSI